MRFITLLCCFLVASVSVAKDLKVATVDLKKLFNEYPGTDKAKSKLKALADKEEKDLYDSDQAQSLKKLEKELSNSGSVMSDTKKKLKQEEYNTKLQALQKQENEIRSELADKETEMTQSLLDQIKTIVSKVAKDNGADLVLNAENTVYVKDGVDLTDAVLKNYKSLNLDTKDDSDSKTK